MRRGMKTGLACLSLLLAIGACGDAGNGDNSDPTTGGLDDGADVSTTGPGGGGDDDTTDDDEGNDNEVTTSAPDTVCEDIVNAGVNAELVIALGDYPIDDPSEYTLTDLPCTVESVGPTTAEGGKTTSFACPARGDMHSITVEYSAQPRDAAPWAVDDEVVLNAAWIGEVDTIVVNNLTVGVRTPNGALLLAGHVDDDEPSGAIISPLSVAIDSRLCASDEESNPAEVRYTLEDDSVALLGNQEVLLDTETGSVQIRQSEATAGDFGHTGLNFSFVAVAVSN